MKYGKWISMILFLPLMVLFNGCGSDSVTSFKGFQMNMPYCLQIGSTLSRHDRASIKRIVDTTFAQVNQVSNHWNEHSELSFINSSKAGHPIKLSPYLSQLITLANSLHDLTDGRYDPTLSPLIQLWKSSLNLQKTPTQKEVYDASRRIGWEHFTHENQILVKDIDGLRIDLDSVAKGMAVDILVSHLVEAGFENVYFEWAGEIRAHGNHPEGRSWQINIFGPQRSEKDLIKLDNEAIATSGNYMQYWVVPDQKGTMKMYSHLINKSSMHPIELQKKSVLSVSVKAPTCALADGLATAAMLFDDSSELHEWTQQVKQQIPGVTFWVVEKQEL